MRLNELQNIRRRDPDFQLIENYFYTNVFLYGMRNWYLLKDKFILGLEKSAKLYESPRRKPG